jgi:hypothetical protein
MDFIATFHKFLIGTSCLGVGIWREAFVRRVSLVARGPPHQPLDHQPPLGQLYQR